MGKAKSDLSVDVSRDAVQTDNYGQNRFDRRIGLQGIVPIPVSRSRKPLLVTGGCMGGAIGHNRSTITIATGAVAITAIAIKGLSILLDTTLRRAACVGFPKTAWFCISIPEPAESRQHNPIPRYPPRKNPQIYRRPRCTKIVP